VKKKIMREIDVKILRVKGNLKLIKKYVKNEKNIKC
jgi:hypothetical protein